MVKQEPKGENEHPTGKDGPSEAAVAGAAIACTMGVPVDPALGFPGEQVADLREEIEAIMDRGGIPDMPTSIDDFDPDEFRED